MLWAWDRGFRSGGVASTGPTQGAVSHTEGAGALQGTSHTVVRWLSWSLGPPNRVVARILDSRGGFHVCRLGRNRQMSKYLKHIGSSSFAQNSKSAKKIFVSSTVQNYSSKSVHRLL